MKIVLSEKEEAGYRIAQALSAMEETSDSVVVNGKRYTFSYWRGRDIVVVPAQGHLFTVWPKGISTAELENLPALDWYWKPESLQARARFKLIKKVVDECGVEPEDFIIATDWDREGEVIGYTVYVHLFRSSGLPPSRMYFNSLMPEDVRSAFQSLGYMNERLLAQGLARNIADSIIGLNITKALTKRFKEVYPELVQATSLGRVQSPVLVFVVESLRQRIERRENTHVSEERSGEVIVKITSRGKTYYYRPLISYPFAELTPPLTVSTAREEVVVQRPEPVKNTDELVTSISGLAPGRAMDAMERMYLKGWLTYPRTESRWVPLELLKKVEEALRTHINLPPSFRAENSPSVDEAYAKEGKTGIVLTPEGVHAYFAGEMDELEKLVASHVLDTLLRTLMPTLRAEVVKLVITDSLGRRAEIEWQYKPLFSSGEVYTYIAFRNYPDIDPSDVSVEVLKFEEEATRVEYAPLYSIVAPVLREVDVVKWMQESGLGTDATRPTYPQLLKERRYVFDELYPTLLGKKVSEIVKAIGITAELTAEMEKRINELETLSDVDRFKEEWVDRYATDFVEKIKRLPEDAFCFRCPRCGAKLSISQNAKTRKIYGQCTICGKKYHVV